MSPDVEPTALLEGFLEIADERTADAIRAGLPAPRLRSRRPRPRGVRRRGRAARLRGRRAAGDGCRAPAAGGQRAQRRGLGGGADRAFRERQVLALLDDVAGELPALLAALTEEARASVAAEGAGPVVVRRRLAELRLLGQESTITLEVADGAVLTGDALHAAFAQRYAAAATATRRRASRWRSLRCASSPPQRGGRRSAAGAGRGGARARSVAPAAAPASAARGARRRCSSARTCAPARGSTGRPSSSIARARACCRRGWSAAARSTGRSSPGGRAAPTGDPQRAALVRQELHTGRLDAVAREMGVMLRAHRPVHQRQGAPGLLVRPARRGWPTARQRAAHARAPGLPRPVRALGRRALELRRGRRGRHESPGLRRLAPAGHHRDHARARWRRRRLLAYAASRAPPRGDRRHAPGLHAAGRHEPGRGRRGARADARAARRRVDAGGRAAPVARRALPDAGRGRQHRRPARARSPPTAWPPRRSAGWRPPSAPRRRGSRCGRSPSGPPAPRGGPSATCPTVSTRPGSSWTTAHRCACASPSPARPRRSTSPGHRACIRTTSTRRPRSCAAAVIYVLRLLVGERLPLNEG